MSIPKEGSRETDEGIIISEAMDWCRSPTAIVPYTIWARQREATDLAQSVRQTGDPSHVKGSVVLKCYGDEPGVGGGVASGTHNAECTPKTWSATVRAEGRNMVRHDDEWWMNHKNTYGRLNYVKDPTSYATPQVASITPLMSPPKGGAAAASGFSTDPTVAPAEGATPSAGPVDPKAFMALAPGGLPSTSRQNFRSTDSPTKTPSTDAHERRTGIVRISQAFPCQKSIGPYGTLSCPGEQAHKYVPDWTMGLTDDERRISSGVGRIPNMPSRDEMPAICLSGNGQNRNTEHGQVQYAVDSKIKDLGNGFVARLGDVLHQSVKETADQLKHFNKGDCEGELQKAVDEAFKGKNKDQLVRADSPSVKIFQGEMDWIMQSPGQTTRAPFDFLNQPQYKQGQ